MGKGDQKSKKGKISSGSYGVKRRSKNADKGLNARLGISVEKVKVKVKDKPVQEAPKPAKAPAATKKTAVEKKAAVEKKPAAEKKSKPAE